MNDAESAALIAKKIITAADQLADAVERYGRGDINMGDLSQSWAFYVAARQGTERN